MYASGIIVVLVAVCLAACGSEAPNQDIQAENNKESSTGQLSTNGTTTSGGKDERRGEIANPVGPGTIILPKNRGKPGDLVYEYGGHKAVNGNISPFGPDTDWARLGVNPSGSNPLKN